MLYRLNNICNFVSSYRSVALLRTAPFGLMSYRRRWQRASRLRRTRRCADVPSTMSASLRSLKSTRFKWRKSASVGSSSTKPSSPSVRKREEFRSVHRVFRPRFKRDKYPKLRQREHRPLRFRTLPRRDVPPRLHLTFAKHA